MDTIESQHSEISSVSEQLTTLKHMVLAGFGGFWWVSVNLLDIMALVVSVQ